ncbi:MAG TPA: M1 family aminopeptidase [Acidimicrobiales bacterium]|nr:M1 family aminopeptidase [Acidimicrobiales bacterium]
MEDRPPYRLPRNVVPDHYSLVLMPDLANAAFDGEASIDVRAVDAATEVILNAAELEISEARFTSEGEPDRPATVSYRPEEEQVVLVPHTPLQTGNYTLFLRFTGQLNDLLRGFYRSKFRRDNGEETWLAATQFEATDARRAFPCWDEPDLKASFGVTIVADEDLTVLSNTQEISSISLGNGKRRVQFADTIKMSTYLVAFVIGPFELTSPRDVDGVPLRIACVPGRGALTGLAGDAATHALRFLRDYFSMPYPSDKLDHVAVPDFASGAMENLGLVTYRETALLVSEDSSQDERQRVVSVIGHETAHMWFGDLVTMRWWDGTWLNEAFATYMELLVTDTFEPRWQIWSNFGIDQAAALATDGLRASRSIEFPVGRPDEVQDMFDVITYDKGAAVLRMIERHLGEDNYRRGLHFYLDKHRYSNTDTTDLWDALEVASGQPVRTTMGTWVDQAGYPLVTAELSSDGHALEISQRRFLLDGGPDKDDQRWVVPISVRYATGDGALGHEQLLLESSSTTIELKEDPAWALVNEGAWGFYRVHYSDELRRRIFASLAELDGRERLRLASDTWAETVAGVLSLEAPVELWSLLSADRDPDVWWGISGGLGLLDLVADDGETAAVAATARRLATGVFSSVGWQPDQDETPRVARLRARLVTLLGTLGADPDVHTEARQRLADADAGRTPLPPDLATAVARVIAAGGGAEAWELLYSHYKNAATPQDEVRYLDALGGFPEADLLRRSIELAFSGEVRSQDAPFLVAGILSRRDGCVVAWEAMEKRWDEMLDRWPPKSLQRALESLPGLAAAGDEFAQRVFSWLDSHPVGLGERRVQQARERLAINLAFKRRVAGRLNAVLGSD